MSVKSYRDATDYSLAVSYEVVIRARWLLPLDAVGVRDLWHFVQPIGSASDSHKC